jgi:hypothetical protein
MVLLFRSYDTNIKIDLVCEFPRSAHNTKVIFRANLGPML